MHYVNNEQAHDKTYNKTCLASKDSGQPVHQPRMVRVLVHTSLDSPETVKGTCDQQKLWSVCADALAYLSLRCSHKSYCRFCRVLAHLFKLEKTDVGFNIIHAEKLYILHRLSHTFSLLYTSKNGETQDTLV